MSGYASPSSGVLKQLQKRACDSCHRRKIKCEGYDRITEKPCKSCESAQLQCTFEAPVLKKGPKGSRAGVINSIKAEQEARSRHGPAGFGLNRLGLPPLRSDMASHQHLMDHSTAQLSLHMFDENLYEAQPFLHPANIPSILHAMLTSPAYAAVVSGIGALVTVCGYGLSISPDLNARGASAQARCLLAESLAKRGVEYLAHNGRNSILCSYLYYLLFNLLGDPATACFYMKEAVNLATVFRLDKEETYAGFQTNEETEYRALFWLLFSADRAQAIHQRCPYSLNFTVDFPRGACYQGKVQSALKSAFHNARLHAILSPKFLELWLSPVEDGQGIRRPEARDMVLQLQNGPLEENFRMPEGVPALAKIGVSLTFLWVKMTVWNLACRHDCIDLGNVEPILTPQYGLEVIREVRQVINPPLYQKISRVLDVMDIVSKVYDIVYFFMDVNDYLEAAEVQEFCDFFVEMRTFFTRCAERTPMRDMVASLNSRFRDKIHSQFQHLHCVMHVDATSVTPEMPLHASSTLASNAPPDMELHISSTGYQHSGQPPLGYPVPSQRPGVPSLPSNAPPGPADPFNAVAVQSGSSQMPTFGPLTSSPHAQSHLQSSQLSSAHAHSNAPLDQYGYPTSGHSPTSYHQGHLHPQQQSHMHPQQQAQQQQTLPHMQPTPQQHQPMGYGPTPQPFQTPQQGIPMHLGPTPMQHPGHSPQQQMYGPQGGQQGGGPQQMHPGHAHSPQPQIFGGGNPSYGGGTHGGQ